jgi:dipeptidyl aminopeptidase/acylaminoacyl peptidase
LQLYLLDPITGAAHPSPQVEGWIEWLHWSPNGRRVLLGVAGHGADRAGIQGAVTTETAQQQLASWIPRIETGEEAYRWRSLWIYDLSTLRMSQIDTRLNIWEAAWCGNDAIVAVASPGSGEGLWYSACLHLIQVGSGSSRTLYTPQNQLGWPASSPGGRHAAVVEAICSDRGLVAGNLLLVESNSGDTRRLDTHGVDITHVDWRSERLLLLAGHRELTTIVGVYDIASGDFTQLWSSQEISTGGVYASASAFGDAGDCAVLSEGWSHAPSLAVISGGRYRCIKSFDHGYAGYAQNVIGSVERLSWEAPDGLDIQGWLLRPQARPAPFPVMVQIHGGPVWHWRPFWLGRRYASALLCLKRGYALFFPNPRGSSGRGQAFARRVWGDVGGADTYDHLSGLDYLVRQGFAIASCVGLTGISYGGFMTSWLITQDQRFAVAVPVSPVTNQVSAHLISNIPDYVALSLADSYTNPNGKYFHRSPVMFARAVKTPTLNVCGALDRCTPPEEAVQFHNALREHGVRSVLATYPEEGHGIRSFPALIDFAARSTGWIEEHMPAVRT